MRNLKHLYLILTLVIIGVTTVYGQERDDRATILNFKGIQYKSSDSLFYVNFRFRMQNRLGYKEELNGMMASLMLVSGG
jgi:hypothetical protein